DDVGTRLELLPDGLSHVVRPVGLAAEAPAVAARHADAPGRGEDAGTGDQPGRHGVAHRQRDPVHAAEIAHRGDAGLDRLLGAEDRLDRPDRDRVLEQHPGRIGLATKTEVEVTVDEPGKQREAVEGELRNVPLAAAAEDLADPPTLIQYPTGADLRNPR